MELLTGELIRLRAVEPQDIERIQEWENNTKVWHVSQTFAPFSRFTIEQYIQTAQLDIFEAKQLRLIIETVGETATPIGAIDLFDFHPHHKRAGIGILINDEKHRGKGYATDALNTLIHYAFSRLELHQLYCNITASNLNSLKLFKKAGFVESGRKREWLRMQNQWEDEIFLQLLNPMQ